MSKTSYYIQAIDIIDAGTDYHKIALTLAKVNPKLFCDIANGFTDGKTKLLTLPNNVPEAVKNIYNNKGLVPAVKYYREITGASLKASKYYVDSVIGRKVVD